MYLFKLAKRVYNEKGIGNKNICSLSGGNGVEIVESDQIQQGKRIKIGNIIIIGTKPIPIETKYAG